jgi:putative addiction module component (TIGR02574 family)
MGATLKSLGIDRLDVQERLTLVGEIWDSIAAEGATVPLTSEQAQELERRLTAYEIDPDDGVPWDEVKASIGKLLRK